MFKFVLVLLMSFSLFSCAHKTKTETGLAPRDWVADYDFSWIEQQGSEWKPHYFNFVVYHRQPYSDARVIYTGISPALHTKSTYMAWKIDKATLEKIMNQAAFSKEELLKNPAHLLQLEAALDSAGSSIGKVSNDKAHGLGPTYWDKDVSLYGDGAAPRVGPIHGDITSDTYIVTIHKLETNIPPRKKEDSKYAVGRLFMYPTQHALMLVSDTRKNLKFKNPSVSVVSSHSVDDKEELKSEGLISADQKVVGYQKALNAPELRVRMTWE